MELDQKKLGEIIEKLGEELLDKDEEQARLASLSLDYINDERTIPYFVKAMESGDNNLMHLSLRSLGKYNNDSAIEGIKKGMKCNDKSVRGAGNTITAISMAENVRLAAAGALRESKHPQAISLLLSMREDRYWPVRICGRRPLKQRGAVIETVQKTVVKIVTSALGAAFHFFRS